MRMKFGDASVNDREGDITQSMIKKIEKPLCKEEWENPRLKNYHRHEPITIGCKALGDRYDHLPGASMAQGWGRLYTMLCAFIHQCYVHYPPYMCMDTYGSRAVAGLGSMEDEGGVKV